MTQNAKDLRKSLRNLGFSQSAIKAAWPEWWSDDAEGSASAQNELRFSLARKLGLSPQSLLETGQPEFVWKDSTKYKHLSAETDFEVNALACFGTSIGRALIGATPPSGTKVDISAKAIREAILTRQPYVRLQDLVSTCWAIGIPVAYLRVFPLQAKRIAAMSVHAGGRYAILLGREAKYPPAIAYYIAHELGHIALRHLEEQSAIVDVGDPLRLDSSARDDEESASDRFALELLTGRPEPDVSTNARSFLAAHLAQTAIEASRDLKIEPGTHSSINLRSKLSQRQLHEDVAVFITHHYSL